MCSCWSPVRVYAYREKRSALSGMSLQKQTVLCLTDKVWVTQNDLTERAIYRTHLLSGSLVMLVRPEDEPHAPK